MRNLTDDFESIVVIIEDTNDLSTLIVEELVGSLKGHELRKKKKRGNPTIKHYKHSLTQKKLGLLKVEVLEVDDEEAKDDVVWPR